MIRSRCTTLAVLVLGIMVATSAWPCSAQSPHVAKRHSSSLKKPPASGRNAETAASLEVLAHFRAVRDCWSDPYMFIVGDDPSLEDDSLYFRCGSEYPLRLAELQDAIGRALLAVSNQSIMREINAAMDVFSDLNTLRRVFDSRAYFITRDVRVSDIFPIVRKYNIPYQENRVSKCAVYLRMMPARRIHIDQLASLVGSAPPDPNPTLTPAQAAAARDDLAWEVTTRQQQGYDWYLRRYSQGRHAAEARDLLGRKDEIRQEQEKELKKIRDELTITTHKLIQAFVRGDKAAFEQLLASNFPSRAMYIARLRVQPNVLSFEIKNLTIQPLLYRDAATYRVKMDVQYRGLLDQRREHHNTFTYQKNAEGWQIIDWHSP